MRGRRPATTATRTTATPMTTRPRCRCVTVAPAGNTPTRNYDIDVGPAARTGSGVVRWRADDDSCPRHSYVCRPAAESPTHP